MVHLSGNIIGVDESGKGDFFGPLVVAGLLAGDRDRGFFEELGVRDSKKISDKRILTLDERLRARLPHRVVVLPPDRYNDRYDKLRNLNILLAECHAEVVGGILDKHPEVDLAVSDKFGKTERLETALAALNCKLPVRQIVRGEAIPQVAAASILARAEFLRALERLSIDCGETLPKGAAPQVDAAGRRLVAAYGPGILRRLAKVHFKNYRRALAGDMFAQ